MLISLQTTGPWQRLLNAAAVYSVKKHLVSSFVMNIHSVYVVVNFLSQVIFVFLLFLGMVMYANEVGTK